MSAITLESPPMIETLTCEETKTSRLLGRFLLAEKGSRDSLKVGYRLGLHLQEVLGQTTDSPFVEFEEGAPDMTEIATRLLRSPEPSLGDKLESDMEADMLGYAVSVAQVLEGGLPLDESQKLKIVMQLYRRARTTA